MKTLILRLREFDFVTPLIQLMVMLCTVFLILSIVWYGINVFWFLIIVAVLALFIYAIVLTIRSEQCYYLTNKASQFLEDCDLSMRSRFQAERLIKKAAEKAFDKSTYAIVENVMKEWRRKFKVQPSS